MPNRLQWWRDRLTHAYTLIGACIVAVLFAIAPDLASYFAGRFLAHGAVIGPVGPRAVGDTVGPVTQGGGPETYTLSPKRIRENIGSPSVYYYSPVTQEK